MELASARNPRSAIHSARPKGNKMRRYLEPASGSTVHVSPYRCLDVVDDGFFCSSRP